MIQDFTKGFPSKSLGFKRHTVRRYNYCVVSSLTLLHAVSEIQQGEE